ncbi:MAG: cysteinyl-tRNA synthetase [Thermoleophilaceae bacterium]|nr:cysteinyl-tRNA synthetase [Thermoleophilaceae bacterium]
MTVRIFDTLTRTEQQLSPRENHVGIYACGPTVYAPVHVGNARPYVVFSLLKRFLTRQGYDVTFVANITDVNDKIYDAARAAGEPSEDLARKMTERYRADTERLGLGRPDHEPLASETIGPIVGLIEDLIDSGHAYAANGDAYFRVRSFDGYGKLSNRPLEEMDQGEADDEGPKEDPHDFALWKAQKPGEDTAWDAPWGRGRPGWHIECSAMAEHILGLDFDVHGGGSDLIFPHHENEIAQTEAARELPLAKIWMHNGMLQFDREKMSKSVGNITSLAGALDEYGRDALVMFFVRSHYRKPIEYSPEALEQATQSVKRIRELARRLDPSGEAVPGAQELEQRFYEALASDFNTAEAVAIAFELVSLLNRQEPGHSGGPLRDMLWCLGLDNLLDADEDTPDEHAERLLAERQQARADRDFATADARRDELAALGWEVRDTPEGPKLVRRD